MDADHNGAPGMHQTLEYREDGAVATIRLHRPEKITPADEIRNALAIVRDSMLPALVELYETWIDNFTLCPVLAVPADDLDYVTHPGHLRLIIQKVEEKLTGKEEVVFEADEMAKAAED